MIIQSAVEISMTQRGRTLWKNNLNSQHYRNSNRKSSRVKTQKYNPKESYLCKIVKKSLNCKATQVGGLKVQKLSIFKLNPQKNTKLHNNTRKKTQKHQFLNKFKNWMRKSLFTKRNIMISPPLKRITSNSRIFFQRVKFLSKTDAKWQDGQLMCVG